MPTLTKTHADVAGLSFTAMRALVLHEADEHGLPVLENLDTRVLVGSPYGAFGVSERSAGVRLHLDARDAASLFALREAMVAHIEHYLPDVAEKIRWSDAPAAGGLPPNFQFARLISSVPLCSNFHRITLKLATQQGYDDAAIHFRFAIPQHGIANPQWPTLGENGSIRWPTGDKALHRPVYTVQSQSEDGVATVDIFRHDGGRTLDWAERAAPGDDIAMIGPGGGGVPDAETLLLCGDETAYPAIARILACRPDAVSARVLLFTHDGATDYPLPLRTHDELTWVSAQQGTAFAEAALTHARAHTDCFLWFAGEAAQASAVRAALPQLGISKTTTYVAAFWSA